MSQIGILCLAATGHLNTFLPLAQELQQRGHSITFFSSLEVQPKVEAFGFGFEAVCSNYSSSNENSGNQQQSKGGLFNIRRTLQDFAVVAESRLKNAPAIIQSCGIDMLLVDLSVFEGGTIADKLRVPYVTVCCLLPFYQDVAVPPIFTTRPYSLSGWSKLRNWFAYRLSRELVRPIQQVIASYRQRWQLPPQTNNNDYFSELAIITRHIREFEFPRQLPPHFHFTGPFHRSLSRSSISFPYEQLDSRPLVYASMGTLQNRSVSIFQQIARACVGLEAQLVISLGGGLTPDELPTLAGNPIVVSYAPQLELLRRASLTITHAGLNTALESLSYGVPMVAIPITDDQPGVATRIRWTGAGELVSVSQLDTLLKATIEKVLNIPTYKQNAMRLKRAIEETDGVNYACDVIEQVISTGEVVTRPKIRE